MTELLHLPVRGDADVVHARQRVREAAALLGMGLQDQTRLATAVSEAARATCAAGGGSLRLSVLQDGGGGGTLAVELRHPGDAAAETDHVLEVVGRLVDGLDRHTHGVTVRKHLPGGERIEGAQLDAVRLHLEHSGDADPLDQARQQNRDLAVALAHLREREVELVRVNEELAETNRGVVALYVELEVSAERVRNAQRQVFAELEDALRPPPPQLPGTTLAIRYLPAQVNSPTGGDLYDWLVLADGSLHIAVVDVAGHGVESTRTALDVTHALRTLTRQGHPLSDIVGLADSLLSDQEAVATVLLGRYDPATGQMELAGGGHPPALLLAAGSSAHYVEAPGGPVGYPSAGSDGTASFTLAEGDTLLLYTDGLIEIERDILLGMQTLLTVAEQVREQPLEQLLDHLLETVRDGSELRDDTLILALRRTAAPPRGGSLPEAPAAVATPLRLAGVPGSAKTARDHVAAVCTAWHLSEELSQDAQLIASELVANACIHVGGTVQFGLQRRVTGLRLEVRDASARTGLPADPGSDAVSGRGLFIVEALATAWGITVEVDAKTIWIHLDE